MAGLFCCAFRGPVLNHWIEVGNPVFVEPRTPVIRASLPETRIVTREGALGFIRARDRDGRLLIAGRKMTGVSDKQVHELGIDVTPQHPETELRKAGVLYESATAFRDLFATHVVVDQEQRFVTGQNQNSGHETAHEMMRLIAQRSRR